MSEMTLRPSAGRDVFDLLNALARAGWGALAEARYRGARIVLRDLADASYDARQGRAGVVTTTVTQIMDRTGYKDRWVRESLYLLEELGLIEWARGGIVQGKPAPSYIRIIKTAIADLVASARHTHDEILKERARAFEERLRRSLTYLNVRVKPRRRAERSSGTGCRPSPHKGEERGATAARPAPTAGDSPRKKEDPPVHEYMPEECSHRVGGNPWNCNACRYEAMRTEQETRRAEQDERRRQIAEQETREEAQASAWINYMERTYPHLTRRQWVRISNDGSDPVAASYMNRTNA